MRLTPLERIKKNEQGSRERGDSTGKCPGKPRPLGRGASLLKRKNLDTIVEIDEKVPGGASKELPLKLPSLSRWMGGWWD